MTMLTEEQLATIAERRESLATLLRLTLRSPSFQAIAALQQNDPVAGVVINRFLNLCKAVMVGDSKHLLDDAVSDAMHQEATYTPLLVYDKLAQDSVALGEWQKADLGETFHTLDRAWGFNWWPIDMGILPVPSISGITIADIHCAFLGIAGGVHDGPPDPVSIAGTRWHTVQDLRHRIHRLALQFTEELNPLVGTDLPDLNSYQYDDTVTHFRGWLGLAWKQVQALADNDETATLTIEHVVSSAPSRTMDTRAAAVWLVEQLEWMMRRGVVNWMNGVKHGFHSLMRFSVTPRENPQPTVLATRTDGGGAQWKVATLASDGSDLEALTVANYYEARQGVNISYAFSDTERIHAIARVFQHWDTLNVDNTGAEYERTRVWFKAWIGYTVALINAVTPTSSLSTFTEVGVVETITDPVEWSLTHLEHWTQDAGVDKFREIHSALLVAYNLILRLTKLDETGAVANTVLAIITADQWETYQTTNYQTALDTAE